jgi:hypothetical protein
MRVPWQVVLACAALAGPAFGEEDPPDDFGEGLPPVTFPALPGSGTSAKDFVPAGWKLEREQRGDLDKDGREDLALVLRMDAAENRVDRGGPERLDTNPRMLAVALAREGGGYRKVLQDHELLPRVLGSNVEEPLDEDGLSITKGLLKVKLRLFLSMGGWTTYTNRFTFRFQEGCFKLIGYDRAEVNRGSGATEDVSINYLTGQGWKAKGSIESDKPGKRVKLTPSRRPLRCLGEVGNGLEFSG